MSKQTISRAIFNHIRPASFKIIASALIVTGITASAYAWLGPAGKAWLAVPVAKGQAVSVPSPTATFPTQERVEAETITLTTSGFEPTEVRRPAGRVLLAVSGLSGLDETTLRLENEGGQVLHEVTLGHRRQRWRKVVDLTAGVYALTVAGHQEWRCQIFIY